MRKFVAVDGAGRIVFEAQCPTTAEAAALAAVNNVVGPMVEVPMAQSSLTTWWDGEVFVARPVPPAPPALVAGVAATWAGLPVGALVTVTDPVTGVVAGTGEADASGDLALTLPAGPWRLSVNEVFPALAGTWLIEVAPE